MPEIKGITGTVLRVNLSDGRVYRENTPADAVRDFLGGRGLGAWYLYSETSADTDPLGPDNRLIFMTGPLTGSMIPGSNKVNVTFKSPLTGTYSYSLCGGHWGPELKFAGYDGLIVEGRADSPVYIWIDDDRVEIRSAEKLWGKVIPETEEIMKEELGGDMNIHAAVIGPAGEKLNRMACITVDWYREFGRGGCGAVMGSKNLKGIAVRGTGDISFADTAGVMALSEELTAAIRGNPALMSRREYGTAVLVKTINENGLWCTRNFSENHFEEGYRLEGTRMREEIVVGDASCYGCPLACGKRSYVKSDRFGNMLIEGPEFETIGLLGANCGVSDWDALVRATQICDSYGFDTMNAGGCVALAMECFEKGIIGLEDTGGIELRFGSGEALVQVLQLMADREGIGDILAEGIKPASEKFGAPELGIHSKGQGFPVYDPRGAKGMALTYATSPKGAHHMIATTFGGEIASGTRLSIEGKGKLQKEHQLSMCVIDSLLLCSTMRGSVGLGDQAVSYEAVSGIPTDDERLNRAAERIINLERMYNVRMGFSRKHDTLPKRILEEPVPAGPSRGSTVDLDPMLDEFYDVMGWDRNGIPTPEKIRDMELDKIIG